MPSGIHHPLQRGTTISMLSRTYRVPVETLLAANRIVDPTSIPAGRPIFVPGATKVLPLKPRAFQGPRLAWPLRGPITSPFGATARRPRHAGVDIDGALADPIRAAADGRVVRVASNARYGRFIVVDHAGDYATLYAHACDLLVREGAEVTRGQVIALVGKSGNAHGTHLHFEVRRKGRPVDPLSFLETGRTSSRLAAR